MDNWIDNARLITVFVEEEGECSGITCARAEGMMEEDVEGKVKLEGHAARNDERCKRRKRREEGDRMAVYDKRPEHREQRIAAKGYLHPVLQGFTTQDAAGGAASCTSWPTKVSDWSRLPVRRPRLDQFTHIPWFF